MDNSIFSSFSGTHKMLTRYKKRFIKIRKNDRIISDTSDEDYDPSKDKCLSTNSSASSLNILDEVVPFMPKEKPRYLMGVGTPSDILGAVKRGIDMFDCVLPTRSGRTGLAFTWGGKLNIRNAKYKHDSSPINENTEIRNLKSYSKSYINHLVNSNEILGSMLLTLNNIIFYQELMTKIRENIKNNTFNDFYNRYINVI